MLDKNKTIERIWWSDSLHRNVGSRLMQIFENHYILCF